MPDQPAVSVVSGVYNGARELPGTLDSVLAREDIDLEYIVVNDGSTDDSLDILEDYARKDERLRVINQGSNQGLTCALITGCAAANGTYIARQDIGDVSLPGRFIQQTILLDENSDVVLVSSWARFLGPKHELLYDVQPDNVEADRKLRVPDAAILRGPAHHGCTMFRRADYQAVGGYRPQFRVAQDLDLWTRLVERGSHRVIPEILYVAELSPGAISSLRRDEQVDVTQVIANCMRERGQGGSDVPCLLAMDAPKVKQGRLYKRAADALFYHFVGGCLRHTDRASATQYYLQAVRANPFLGSTWFRLAQTFFSGRG